MTIQAKALTPEAYSRFGEVIAALDGNPFSSANFGRAKRFNHLAQLANLRPASAHLNLCIFRLSQFPDTELELRILEKHPFSTQAFMPMQDGCYLTVVAEGGDAPELSTLSAFLVTGPQGITYKPGIWHYPMTAVGPGFDMSCLVFEDDSKGDCMVYNLPQPVTVRLK